MIIALITLLAKVIFSKSKNKNEKENIFDKNEFTPNFYSIVNALSRLLTKEDVTCFLLGVRDIWI